MGGRWNPIGLQFLCFLVLIIGLEIQSSWSLNDEGLILLEFRERVRDPFGAFADWNPDDNDPCSWFGVFCVNGKVQMLDLNGLSFAGALPPELSKLSHLRSLVLYKNQFSDTISERDDDFSGTMAAELGRFLSLKHLLLCDNKFEGGIPLKIKMLNLLSESQFKENLLSVMASEIGCMYQKLRNGFKLGEESSHSCGGNYCDYSASSSKLHLGRNVEISNNLVRRRLLEQSSNLLAAPTTGGFSSQPILAIPTLRSSGTFPAVLSATEDASIGSSPLEPPDDTPSQGTNPYSSGTTTNQPPPAASDGNTWIYFLVIPIVAIVIIVAAGLLFMCRKKGVTTIGPWKTGLSGQLQKAFVTGVPKLNRSELETACEDFSNIIDSFDGGIVYKGTLSSGVEIAVASTTIVSSKEWSKNAEMSYRKKIDTLSRINHKNFVNLIGFCEEDEPFNRMMVFEYAPNGTLFEHLHVKEMEHLDWNARMRIIMGTAYCLQYMHHDLNPPIAQTNLSSNAIYLTDDYAAKIAEVCFLPHAVAKKKISGDDEEHSLLPPLADPETNVYSFGKLLLEIISGKLPYSEEQGPLEKWAAEFLNDKRKISCLVDPTLKSFKHNELDVVCEVIQECIQTDPRQRPTMKDVTSKLREVISISPDQATPRLSPLWWAELEILSVEAT